MKKQKPNNEVISKNTFTIPNIISLFRILLITPFVVFFLNRDYIVAAVILVVSGISDFLDGVIARRFHQESELGKILDPLADKLTLIAVGICLIFIEPFVLPLMIIMVTKDLLMLVGGSIVIKQGVIPPKSKWYGKLSTVLFYVTVSLIVVMKIFNYVNRPLSIILLAVTAFMMLFSLINYIGMYIQIQKDLKKSNQTKEVIAQVTKDESQKEGEGI
ncbi:MAG: CDP-alcohol phosphatidyltransferase family protein [Ruminococcus sp.]|nr:CDP-alcohol phosphatidyltransferase family protein [Ruminococcus sp.]